MSKETIFVYGTLMNGLEAHWMLEHDGVGKVGWGETPGVLIDLGAFPAAYPRDFCLDCEGTIKGELYRVPKNLLRMIDCYEGADFHGGLYRRERVVVRARRHEHIPPDPLYEDTITWEETAWIYFCNEKQDGEHIGSGDWREHLQRRSDSLTV